MHWHAGNDNAWRNLLSHPKTCIFAIVLGPTHTHLHVRTQTHWHTSLSFASIEWNVPQARTIVHHVEFVDLIEVFSVFWRAL